MFYYDESRPNMGANCLTATQPWVKTFRRKVAHHKMDDVSAKHHPPLG
ncbi:MAG: hypothetical protein LBI18_03315 [Planctomycetaceae bacterium]|nr:hypothetical protein [Planctomycetaceae bacterium]